MDKNCEMTQHFFLKRAGRITGPFSFRKLNMMFRTGGLTGYDMFSVDKVNWKYVSILFPELLPEALKVQTAERKGEALSQEIELASFPVEAENKKVFQAAEENTFTRKSAEGAQEVHTGFFSDMATTVSLIWKYHLVLPTAGEKWKNILLCAFLLNGIAAVAMVLLFGKYYSRAFHYFFSLFTALGLLAVLLGFSFGASWLLGRCGKKNGEFTPGEWQICACAFFMDYGLISCSLMGLLHTLKSSSPAGWIVLFAVNGITLCATSSLLSVSFKRFRNIVAEGLFLSAVPVNVLLCTGIWYFVKMI